MMATDGWWTSFAPDFHQPHFFLTKQALPIIIQQFSAPSLFAMGIKISEIPQEGLAFELAGTLDLFDRGSPSAPFTAALGIKPVGGGAFLITGRIDGDAELECSRCLVRFPCSVHVDVNFELAPAKVMSAEPQHELEQAELDTEFYQGDEIDPEAIIKEQVLLSLPMVPLHSPGCKGLCTVCGTDRNVAECGCRTEAWEEEAGAFSVLRDLFKK